VSEQAGRFGIGPGTPRVEDAALLTGGGRFTDDVPDDGHAHAVFVRSPHAHARITGFRTEASRFMPGVLQIIHGADLADRDFGAIPPALLFKGRGGRTMASADMPVLALDRVRYVGEPVVMVVAETQRAALDAAAKIEVLYEPLPVAADVKSALAPGAPSLHPDAIGNVALDWEDGDAGAVAAAFATAHHIARTTIVDGRLAPASMEPRAAIGHWDQTSGYTLVASTQGVAVVRKLLAESVFRIPLDRLRVVTHDVGGGFGMKAQSYCEYAAVLYAAQVVGRPVRWTATRLESFLGDTAGRDHVLEGEMAFDRDGRMLALRVKSDVGLGAYTTTFSAIFSTNNTKNCLASVYKVPLIHIGVRAVLTNAAPLGPYRGAGRPEAIILIERLIDLAAGPLGIDRVELRRRNLIPREAMPYKAPNAMVYDSGDFPALLDRVLALSDWAGFPARRAAAEKRGRLRGIGLCAFLEVAGGILDEVVDLRFTEDDHVEMRTGAQAMGQGHLSTFPPLVAHSLGIDVSRIRLVEGDSDAVPAGTPSVASRSIMMAGSAAFLACEEAVRRGRDVAGALLEAAPADLEYRAGSFRVAGTDRAVSLFDVARKARETGAELDNKAKFVSPQMSFPNGCHVCEVEIDPVTGVLSVERYSAVDDVGHVLHEPIVEGQIHGGVVQGLGQILGERVVYDASGQLVTASFMDYVMPRADDVPMLDVVHHPVPCTTNPLGAKGAGESGVAGALPSAFNAVMDALAARGVRHIEMPMTSERIWRALQSA
jgi:carbon-monoxide dehydrogenase large subunit